MAARVAAHNPTPSENWDEDFEFQQTDDHGNNHGSPTRASVRTNHHHDTLLSAAFNDFDHLLSTWAEPGPSNRSAGTLKVTATQEENWDEDFEDATDAHAASSSRSREVPRISSSSSRAPEDWDKEFGTAASPPKLSSPTRHPREASWESSDEEDDAEMGFSERDEEDRTVTARTRKGAVAQHSPPPPVPPLPAFPLFRDPGAPEPFPRSPTMSTFSIPVSGRDSIGHSSTAHLALRPTLSAGSSALGNLPPSPPIHRERRRLRKKSRPHHFEDNIYELEDRTVDPSPAVLRKKSRPPNLDENIYELDDRYDIPPAPSTPLPSTPPSPLLPPTTPLTAADTSTPVSPTTTSTNRSPLLSRIGSVKKWGAARKKRASTGPAEVMSREHQHVIETTPRPASALAHLPPSDHAKSSGGWFFRGPGGSGAGSPAEGSNMQPLAQARVDPDSPLRHEKSRDRLRFLPAPPESPTRRTNTKPVLPLVFSRSAGDIPPDLEKELKSPSLSFTSAPRRPSSMQVSDHNRPVFGRHASQGGDTTDTSVGRAAAKVFVAATLEGLSHGDGEADQSKDGDMDKHEKKEDVSGSRSFMGGVRRISLVGRHKRTKSTTVDDIPPPALPPVLPPSQASDARLPSFEVERLLPPIELSPPSPPRTLNGISQSHSAPQALSSVGLDSLSPGILSKSHIRNSSTSTISPRSSPTKVPGSPQSASLGRCAAQGSAIIPIPTSCSAVPRRNSLGDLKIPARISKTQVALRRDLWMVREFAASVEHLKELQATYVSLVAEIRGIIDAPPPPPRSLFNLARPPSRARSNTNPPVNTKQIALDFQIIDSKYKIPWECAELLIEIGSGTGAAASPSPPPPPSSISAPVVQASISSSAIPTKGRERAITLAGDESKPDPGSILPGPPPASPPDLSSWRASTGRHDLSQRQLLLLKEMLNSPDPSSAGMVAPDSEIPEDMVVNRSWRWGDAMNSTVTLPSEESAAGSSPTKKRRTSRMGMSGIRDMLRSLKKNRADQTRPSPSLPVSSASGSASASASADSSLDNHGLPVQSTSKEATQRKPRGSHGPESIKALRARHPNSPYMGPSSVSHKASPRRPSLASIFRLGSKSKSSSITGTDQSLENVIPGSKGVRHGAGSRDEEEDWDRMEDSTSQLDLSAVATSRGVKMDGDATATVRGKKKRRPYLQGVGASAQRPVTPRRNPSASQSSIWNSSPDKSDVSRSLPSRPPFDEADTPGKTSITRPPHSPIVLRHKSSKQSPRRSLSRDKESMLHSGSVRSAPPDVLDDEAALPDPKLAMTPDNIKPLLENAQEVLARLVECVEEVRKLLSGRV